MQHRPLNVPPGRAEMASVADRLRFVALLTAAVQAGCLPLAGREARAAHASVNCMQATLDQRLPDELPNDMAHCMAAGLIARYCSRSEAWMASVGKEAKDAVSGGDAEWRDLTADRVGMKCAREVSTDEALKACCESHVSEAER